MADAPRQKSGGRSHERLQLGVRAYYRGAAEGYTAQSDSPRGQRLPCAIARSLRPKEV